MFLDASVVVAAMADEPEGDSVMAALVDSDNVLTSPLAIFEISCRIARLRSLTIEDAFVEVERFLAAAGVTQIAIDRDVSREAHLCASRYHHSTGHRARLNMGDCFAYAAARKAGVSLAYKGNDFVHTDIDGVRFDAAAEKT